MSADKEVLREGHYMEMHTHEIENMKLVCFLLGMLGGTVLTSCVAGVLWVVY